jgi:hypothetical protein
VRFARFELGAHLLDLQWPAAADRRPLSARSCRASAAEADQLSTLNHFLKLRAEHVHLKDYLAT